MQSPLAVFRLLLVRITKWASALEPHARGSQTFCARLLLRLLVYLFLASPSTRRDLPRPSSLRHVLLLLSACSLAMSLFCMSLSLLPVSSSVLSVLRGKFVSSLLPLLLLAVLSRLILDTEYASYDPLSPGLILAHDCRYGARPRCCGQGIRASSPTANRQKRKTKHDPGREMWTWPLRSIRAGLSV